ncbi:MAG: 2-dehydropantoate 2-reductase [Gammaproteobacteria bacterium]
MKVCIVGAGAIGGFLGVRLALSGQEVSLVARGAHLEAIKANGLKLIQDGEEHVASGLLATDRLDEIGPQDVVALALKAHQIAPVAADLVKLLGPDTALVTLQNGIPWWYFQKVRGPYEGHAVETVDPQGFLARTIDPDRIVGCIAYPAAEIAEPGVIRHVEGIRFPVGEIDNTESERVKAIAEMLIEAGFKAPVLPDIRSEIWLKLWGNLTFNPISALTHSTLEDICQYAPTRRLAATMMAEAQAIGEKLGATFRVTLDKRIEGAEKVGRHKTSMLQDVEAGKPLEIDGMLGAVIELAELTQTPAPTLNAIYECVSLLNKTVQTEQVRIRAQSA